MIIDFLCHLEGHVGEAGEVMDGDFIPTRLGGRPPVESLNSVHVGDDVGIVVIGHVRLEDTADTEATGTNRLRRKEIGKDTVAHFQLKLACHTTGNEQLVAG